MERLLPIVGLLTILGIAYAFSTDRKAIQPKTVLWGIGLQFALALFVLKTNAGQLVFSFLGEKIRALLEFSFEGSSLVFGELGKKLGGASGWMIFGFQV